VTAQEPRIRLPRFTTEALAILVAGMIAYSATTFVNMTQQSQKIEDRLNALEKEQITMLNEQQVNSKARIELEVQMRHLQETVNDNNMLLREHISDRKKVHK
jgi:uncharacterized membrane protein